MTLNKKILQWARTAASPVSPHPNARLSAELKYIQGLCEAGWNCDGQHANIDALDVSEADA